MRELQWNEQTLLQDRAHSVCFSGHRPDRLPQRCDEQSADMQTLKAQLRAAIESYIRQGYLYFFNGGMMGFDLLAAEAVLELQCAHPQIFCITIVPFSIGYFARNGWSKAWKRRCQAVCYHSNLALSLDERYQSGVYYARDRFLVDSSAALLCYHDGGTGGTAYTISCAHRANIPVTNLAPCQPRACGQSAAFF